MNAQSLPALISLPLTPLRFELTEKLARMSPEGPPSAPRKAILEKLEDMIGEVEADPRQLGQVLARIEALKQHEKTKQAWQPLLQDLIQNIQAFRKANEIPDNTDSFLRDILIEWGASMFTETELRQFHRKLVKAGEDDSLTEEWGNLLDALQSGTPSRDITLDTPEKQLLWGAGLLWLMYNPHAIKSGNRKQKATSVEKSSIWYHLLKSPQVRYLRALFGSHAFNLLKNNDILIGWGSPGSWFSFEPEPAPGKITCDLLYSLFAGFDHARACAVHEIAHAVLSKGAPEGARAVHKQITDLNQKAKATGLSKEERIERELLKTELDYRQTFLNICEDNCINRFATEIGKVFGQNYGYSLNYFYAAIGDVGRRYTREYQPYKNDSPENRFSNLAYICSREFLANNDLFPNTVEGWETIKARPDWVTGRHRRKPDTPIEAEGKAFQQLLGMLEEVEHLFPPLQELAGGPRHYGLQARDYCEMRYDLIDKIYDLHAKDWIDLILKKKKARLEEESMQDEHAPDDPNQEDQNDEKDPDKQEDAEGGGSGNQNIPGQDPAPPPPGEDTDEEPEDEPPPEEEGEPEEEEPDQEQQDPEPPQPEQQPEPPAPEEQEQEEAEQEDQQEEEQPPQPPQPPPEQEEEDDQGASDEEQPEDQPRDPGQDEQSPEEQGPDDSSQDDSSQEQEPTQDQGPPPQDSEGSEGEEAPQPELQEQPEEQPEDSAPPESQPEVETELVPEDPNEAAEEQQEEKESLDLTEEQLEEIMKKIEEEIKPREEEPDDEDNTPREEMGGSEDGRGGDHPGKISEHDYLPDSPLASIGELMEAMQDIQNNTEENLQPTEKRRQDPEPLREELQEAITPPEPMSLDELAGGSWEDFARRVSLHAPIIAHMAQALRKLKEAQYRFLKAISRKHSLTPEGGDLRRFDHEAMDALMRKLSSGKDFHQDDLNLFRTDQRIPAPTRPARIILIDGSASMAMGNLPTPIDKAVQEAVIDYMAAKIAGYDTYISMFGPANPLIIAEPGEDQYQIGKRIELVRGGLNTATNFHPALLQTIQMVANRRKFKEPFVGFTNFVIYSDGDIDDPRMTMYLIQEILQYAPKTTFDFVLITEKNRTPVDMMLARMNYDNPVHQIGIVRSTANRQLPLAMLSTMHLTQRIRRATSGFADPAFLRRGQFRRLLHHLIRNFS